MACLRNISVDTLNKGDIDDIIIIIINYFIILFYYIILNYKNKILKKEIESKCLLCKQREETIDHLTSGCPILAKNEYLMRQDKVCTHLH